MPYILRESRQLQTTKFSPFGAVLAHTPTMILRVGRLENRVAPHSVGWHDGAASQNS